MAALGVALERRRGAALLLGRPGHQLAVDRVRDRARRERQALPGGPESRDHAHRRKSHANGRHLRARVRSAFACARVLGNPRRLGDLAASGTPLAPLLARTDDARLRPARACVPRDARALSFERERERDGFCETFPRSDWKIADEPYTKMTHTSMKMSRDIVNESVGIRLCSR